MPTYQELKAMAMEEAMKGLKLSLNAPSRRGWSRMTGQSIASKNEVLRASNQNIRNICAMSAEFYPNEPALIADEEPVKPVTVAS